MDEDEGVDEEDEDEDEDEDEGVDEGVEEAAVGGRRWVEGRPWVDENVACSFAAAVILYV